MKKRMFCRYIVLAAALLMSMPGSAPAVDSTITVNAVIQQASLTVSNATVDFGTIISAGADTVIIDASAGAAQPVATTGALTNITVAGSSGTINVTSTVPNAIVDITYPASIVIDDDTTGLITMTVDQIATYSTPTPLTLDGAGSGTIYVGGRLSISAGQTADTYASGGADVIAVNYQ
ncbi:MAG: DUF4402 domain-containing protein [Desulfobacterales bacterium]|nr:DUF4402 domain-containing protein [Desulfobacterales bacterium]